MSRSAPGRAACSTAGQMSRNSFHLRKLPDMTDNHGFFVPSSFTTPIAAHILKTTPESLMSLVRCGSVRPEPSGSLLRFSRVEVERILGRPLTVTDWLAAEEAHEPRREVH